MTFNEINNQRNWRAPLFGYCCSGVVYTEHENPEETMYQVLHHQFVASALAVKAARRINPEMKVGCMLAMVALYPFSCKPEDVMFAQESMRERYVFTDVQLRGYYPSYVLNEGAPWLLHQNGGGRRADPARRHLRLPGLQLLHDQRGESGRRHRRCDFRLRRQRAEPAREGVRLGLAD
jgi:hypothetical protein